ncbi:hypothetical protein [Leifsonia sp. P73]|uniref:hypothetical protein n=1 Tax=Leifsonia sp. P73 TaxID=3423959 RepID=UPI003DA47968
MIPITSPSWWKAAAIRGARTAVTIALPYLLSAAVFTDVPWLSVGSAAGLGFIASLITSLAGLPEVNGKAVSVWLALLERVTKTFAQGLAVGIGNAVLFQNVHWTIVLQAAAIAALGSLLLGVLSNLPEVPASVLPVLVDAPVNTGSSVKDAVAAAVVTPADPSQPAAGTPPAPPAAL